MNMPEPWLIKRIDDNFEELSKLFRMSRRLSWFAFTTAMAIAALGAYEVSVGHYGWAYIDGFLAFVLHSQSRDFSRMGRPQ